MTKTLIVPGLDGSPSPHWQNWWAHTDPDAIMIELPDAHRPIREAWEAALAAQVLRYPDSILVGHSLGAVLIAHILTRWPNLRVRAAMLVAPADPGISKRLERFGPLPRRAFGIPSTLIASRNDPWMRFDQCVDLAGHWGSTLTDLGYAGHVNVNSGFGPWPSGKLYRDDLMHQTAHPSFFRRLYSSGTGRPRGLPA